MVRSNLVKCSQLMVKQAVEKFETLGFGQLRRFNCRRPVRGFLLGGGVISASVTKEGLRAEEVSQYEFSAHKPSKEAFTGFYKEIDEAEQLTLETLTCRKCGLRLRIDGELAEVSYCHCPDSPKSVFGVVGPSGWSPFLERRDILVWRRQHSSMKGMYEYKMYGSFADVTAEEFLFVQNDLSRFRTSWDSSTKEVSQLAEEGSSVVYYWEVNWPRFFSNRDYCCHRTVQTDSPSSTTACVSSSTEHPACKAPRGLVRVTDYTSVLTVRPHQTSDRPGLHFCLTGFENPGVALPESIITWVAIRAMPEFMLNLRTVCHRLRREREECSGRFGRQEDNFGQLHQRRQAAYA